MLCYWKIRGPITLCLTSPCLINAEVYPAVIAPADPHIAKGAPSQDISQVQTDHCTQQNHARASMPAVYEVGGSSADASRGSRSVQQPIYEFLSRPALESLQVQIGALPEVGATRNSEGIFRPPFHGQDSALTLYSTQPPSYAEIIGSNEIRLEGEGS